jgi:hypothetical protein
MRSERVPRGCGGRSPIYILGACVGRPRGRPTGQSPASHELVGLASNPLTPPCMFDDVREAFRDLLRRTPPSGDARRSVVAQMRETLVQARMGLDDLRKGVVETRARLTREQSELDTVRRRKQLAASINDAETVAIADRYEKRHAERAALLERKLETQEAELAMVEREVSEMNTEFKLAAAGATPGVSAGTGRSGESPAGAAAAGVDDVLDDQAGLNAEIDGLARARRRADAESAADEKLAALKRRMGK